MNGPEPAVPEMPYRDSSVTFIKWRPDQTVLSSNEVGVKRRWVAEGLPLYAAWYGRHRTDVFEVDLNPGLSVDG